MKDKAKETSYAQLPTIISIAAKLQARTITLEEAQKALEALDNNWQIEA